MKKNRSSKKELSGKAAFKTFFPLAGSHPFLLFGLGGGFGGGNGFYDDDWSVGGGGPDWNDNVPPYSGYDGDDWGNFNGYGSPENPIQLDEVSISLAQQNSPSAWAALGWTVAGIAEAVAGVALIPETGFGGVYLVIDGIGRTGLNLANFINDIKGGNVPQLPGNFGGAIGLAFSGEQGAYYGSLANDIITALVGGGAFQNAWDAAQAIADSEVLLAIANGTGSLGNINAAAQYVEDWKATHP